MIKNALKIGDITLPIFAILPPLAGYSDLPFRKIVSKFGAGMTTTEMINTNALLYGNEKTLDYLNSTNGEYIEAIQIFGHEPEIFGRVIREVINPLEDFKILDINFGCPAPKIVKNGDGSALMKNPYLAAKIAEIAVKNSKKPVTCKMRLGFSFEEENFLEIGKLFESVGVSAITLHARFRTEFYEGHSDWSKIKELKEELKIPVIGNGDIISAEDAFGMIDETGCDGVAIGRGAIGNPWIFRDIIDITQERPIKSRTPEELYDVIQEHYEYMKEEKGEYTAVREMRKHLAKYLKDIPEVKKERAKFMLIEDYDELLGEIKNFIIRER